MAFDKSQKTITTSGSRQNLRPLWLNGSVKPSSNRQQPKSLESYRRSKFSLHGGIYVPDLWVPRPQLLTKIGRLVDEHCKGKSAMILASSPLIAVLKKLTIEKGGYEWPDKVADHNPEQAFICLPRCSFRHPNHIFTGPNIPTSMLETCEHILDKAYVRAVIIASKCFGQDRFPNGIYTLWPPTPPADYHSAGFQPK